MEITSKTRTELIPFSRPSLGSEEIEEVVATLRSGWITSGPRLAQFEEDFARYTASAYALGVNSGTAGLHIALLAMGLEPGEEVIVPSLSWPTTANVVIYCGARPVFADVSRETWNLDPEEVARKKTARTRGIIPVHFGGLPCDLERLRQVAGDSWIIEDAAHAVGTHYRGKPIGGLSPMSVFSFHPIKNITTGEGGMVTTQDECLARQLRLLRFHGVNKEAWKRYSSSAGAGYDLSLIGYKYNLTDIAAALGIHQLRKLESFITKRAHLANLYRQKLAHLTEISLPPQADPRDRHAWHLFPIVIETDRLSRDDFVERLRQKKIGTGLHFLPIHLTSYYRQHYPVASGALPVTEHLGARIVSLPLYPDLSEEDVDYVASAVEEVLHAR